MLRCILAVDLDGSPALTVHDFANDDDCAAYLASRVDRDEDGGALAVLHITGKRGDTLNIEQDGQCVAVVVRL